MSNFLFSGDTIFWFISIDTYIDNFISKKVDPFFEIKCETIDRWFDSTRRLVEFTEFMNMSFYFVCDDLKYKMISRKNKSYKIEISITSKKCVSRHFIITYSLMSNIGKTIDQIKNVKLSCIDCKYPMMIPPKNKIKIDDIYFSYAIIYKLTKKEMIVDFNYLFDRIKMIIAKHKEKKRKKMLELKCFLDENTDIKELIRSWL